MAKILIIKEKKETINGREHTVIKETQYYIEDTGKDIQTKYGKIPKKELEKPAGSTIKSTTNKEFQIINADYIDIYKRIKKLPQTIPLKDLGVIAGETGLNKNSEVVDAGLGSGAATIFFANICKKVTSYEIREDHIKAAKENIKKTGLKNITIKKKDITKQIDEKNIDFIMLDLPNPWEALGNAEKALRTGGFLASYSPSIIQTRDFVEKLSEQDKMLHIKTIEVMQRNWEVNKRKVRPKSIEIGHSGFITIARKIKT
ncbi:tRNA (adenine-N1)-methyltransferase [Candidatus Woesearchaeota archaeon]|nr:MAG: tRNA (adenine-N1)-methyltransferase [Candidatus Woesearchaeota archaeon]